MTMKRNSEPQMVTHLHQKGRRLGLPVAGNFELTARCNFNCSMCYVHLSAEQVAARGKELTAQQWLDIAEQARDAGMVFALLTGGEPLLRSDFFEIYEGMKKLGLMISLNTNGSMLEGEIRQRLLDDPPTRINVSLYGSSEQTYRDMCGMEAYARVRKNILALKRAGVDVSLNLSVTPYNRHDLEKIFADARQMDVNVRASVYMYPPVRIDGKYGVGNRLTPEEAAACTVQWERLRCTPEEFALRAKNLAALTQDCPVEDEPGVRCRAGSTSFWITWDGRMLPCGMMPGPEVRPLEEGFAAAWESIRSETKKIQAPAKCGTCDYRKICGVCPAICMAETGSFDGVPEYVCAQTAQTLKAMEENGHGD